MPQRGKSCMRVDKFTVKTREARVEAQHLASQKGQAEILPEHLFLALLRQEGGVAAALLRKLGTTPGMAPIDPAEVATDVEQHIDSQPRASGGHVDVGLSRKGKDL